jgi:Zn-dependent alcohol dehydrogenase
MHAVYDRTSCPIGERGVAPIARVLPGGGTRLKGLMNRQIYHHPSVSGFADYTVASRHSVVIVEGICVMTSTHCSVAEQQDDRG